MKSILLFLPLLLAILIACNSTSEVQPLKFNRIRFNNLQVGQESYYRMFTAKYSDTTNIVAYTNDTLFIKIIGKDNQGYIVDEDFTPYSETKLKDSSSSILVSKYRVLIKNDTLFISFYDTSHIGYSRILKNQLLLADNDSNLVKLKGWQINEGNLNTWGYGYTLNANFNGILYPKLNIYGLTQSLSVNVFIYFSQDFGVVRKLSVLIPGPGAIGFDLINGM